jgi:PAS domain S-box-containing protein
VAEWVLDLAVDAGQAESIAALEYRLKRALEVHLGATSCVLVPSSPMLVDEPSATVAGFRLDLPGFGSLVVDAPPPDETTRAALEHVARRLGPLARALAAPTTLRHLDTLLEAVSDAVIGARSDGVISHWNHGAERLLGYTATQAIGQRLGLIIPERMRDAHERGMTRHMATGEARVIGQAVEMPAVHSGGYEVPVELVLNRVEEQGQVAFVAVLRDLSARRARETQQQAEVAYERRLAAAALELVAESDVDVVAFKRKATEVVAELVGAERVCLWRARGEVLVCVEASTAARAFVGSLRAPQEPPDAGPHSLDLPLQSLQGVLGALSVSRAQGRPWTYAELRFCEQIASLLVQAIDKAIRTQLIAQTSTVLASVGEAVIACERDGRITLANPVAERMLGAPLSDLLGHRFSDFVTVIDATTREALPPPLPEVIATGQMRMRAGMILQRPGAAELHIASTVAPIFDVGDSPESGLGVAGAVITLRDNTNEVAARAEIEQQHSRLRAISEALPDLLFAISADGHLRYGKTTESPDLAVPAAEISRHSVATIFEAQTAALIMSAVRATLETGEVQSVEYPLNLSRGVQHFEARMARLSASEVTVLVRNVSEVRARALALAEERERLKFVLASTSAMIYTAKMPGFEIDYVSDSAQNIMGHTAEAFLSPGFWSAHVHPDDIARVQRDIPQLFVHDRHVHEYRMRHADGHYRWLRDEVRLTRDASGAPARAVGASFDITERRLSEARVAALLQVQQSASRVSAAFLAARSEGTSALIEAELAEIGQFAHATASYVVRLGPEGAVRAHAWTSEAAQRDPICDRDADASALVPHLSKGSFYYLAHETASLLAVPLVIDGQLRGYVGLHNPQLDPLEPAFFGSVLQVFADALAAGLKRDEDERALGALNDRMRQQSARQQALLGLSARMALVEDLQLLVAAVEECLRVTVGANWVALTTQERRPECQKVWQTSVASSPNDLGLGEQAPCPCGDSSAFALPENAGTAVARAIELRQPVTTADHAPTEFSDWRALVATRGEAQFVVMPLLNSDEVIGSLHLSMPGSTPPETDVLNWLAQLASLAAAHLAIQRGQRSLQALNTDLERRVEERTQALRASEERFGRLFDYAPQAMLMVERSGRIVQSNQAAQTLFGYDAQAFGTRTVNDLIPNEQRERHDGLMSGFMAQQHARPMAPDRVVRGLRSDQTPFIAEIGIVPISVDGEQKVLAGITDVSARVAAQESVRASLQEKETLLKEIHHRVKNNLQIISSLLALQSEHMPSSEAKALLQESVYRVRSMALIHQQLYGVESLERIDLADYARMLGSVLRSAYAPSAKVCIEAEPVQVTVDIAVPLGLILNELMTNAFKYGQRLPESAGPRRTSSNCDVLVELSATATTLTLAVSDSGPGLPQDLDPQRAPTLGMQLIRTLNRQVRGTLKLSSEGGARIELTCPRPDEGPRRVT